MKALVTGASGFLGSALVQKLEQLGYIVVPFERIWWFNINFDDLKNKLEDLAPDYIFHLAAYGNHFHQKDEQTTFLVNVFNTFQLLEATKDISYKGFVYFGSSSEYGRKDKPMKEDTFLAPDTFYGATKASGTHLARAFAKELDKPIVTVRPFSVYGPGEGEWRFIPTAIRCLRLGKVLPLADGVHDWIYIEDFIDGVVKVLENAKKLKGQVVNIGTGQQAENSMIVKLLEQISGYPLQVAYDDKVKRSYDTNMWMADNTLLKSLGWKQKYSLEDGLRATYGNAKKGP